MGFPRDLASLLTKRISIDTTNDRVGIGISPTEKLHVDGNVKATSFIGDGSNLTGIVSTLSALTDTSTANISTGDLLQWNGSDWENKHRVIHEIYRDSNGHLIHKYDEATTSVKDHQDWWIGLNESLSVDANGHLLINV